MATSLSQCNTHELKCKGSYPPAGRVNSGVETQSHHMEVKSHVIADVGPAPAADAQSCLDSKQLAARIVELQERQRTLQALLESRLGELRWVCLLEAKLTGELPSEFPLGEGEKAPLVQNRMSESHCVPAQKEEEEASQRMQKKGLLSVALRRQKEAQQQGRRTVHRGCHTDEVVKTDLSALNCTGQDHGEWSPSPAQNHQLASGPCMTPGSPDKRVGRKPSPVEAYGEMRPRRGSIASSDSPSQSLAQGASNTEGRSVPATPLLSRPVLSSVPWRSEVLGGPGAEWTADGLEFSQGVGPFPGSVQHGGAKARRSTSSEALLDRSAYMEEGRRRAGMPPRGGPYRSSETLTDGRSRRGVADVSAGQGRARPPLASRTVGGAHGSALTDCMWGRRPKAPTQPHRQRQPSGGPEDRSSPGSTPNAPTGDGCSPAAHGLPGELRRAKVTRTKSCGPLLSQHQQGVLLCSGHPDSPLGGPPLARRPLRFPSADGPPRGLHKALALEGLRDWYLRNSLSHVTGPGSGQPRRPNPSLHGSHPHPLTHQSQSLQSEQAYLHLHSPQVHLSATFHGHLLHGRSMEFSLYQDLDSSADSPAPGTLV
uniref:Coiled-coil domain containing 120b n=2 Tax=Paramormyrops kingsleyae TaxID=1676925 RepID=A0A3B3SNS7_9TELE|nr:coiled-coil domain-containing protein 120-like isoform X1 [Paramormyrops kingsleyae]